MNWTQTDKTVGKSRHVATECWRKHGEMEEYFAPKGRGKSGGYGKGECPKRPRAHDGRCAPTCVPCRSSAESRGFEESVEREFLAGLKKVDEHRRHASA